MKKFILLAALVFLALTNYAQNTALGTPKFKGIEITGSVEQFGNKLESQGFAFLGKDGTSSMFLGRFAGMDDCVVMLTPVENSNDIALASVAVGLRFSEYGEVFGYETWEQLLGDYNNLKDLLTEKYGEPTEMNEGFSEDAAISTSYLKLLSVREGQCEYYASWGIPTMTKWSWQSQSQAASIWASRTHSSFWHT